MKQHFDFNFVTPILRFRRPNDGEEVDYNAAVAGADGWIIERLSP